MDRRKKTICGLLSIASAVVSCMFIAYGAGVVLGEGVPGWIVAFGVVTAAYGICSLVVLVLAWSRYREKTKKLIGYFAAAFMVLFFLGSLDVGMVSGLEGAGLLIVGLMLLVNWFAVSAVVKLKNVA